MVQAFRIPAAALAMMVSGSALAAWGLRYEVNTGSGWTTATTIDVSSGPKTLDFRIIAYHDGAMQVKLPNGTTKTALAFLRLCNSQRVVDFGSPGSGDALVSFAHTVTGANEKALANAQVGSDMILGTPNVLHSFAYDTRYGLNPPILQKLETPFYAGKLQIGAGAGTSRTITITANSFGYPTSGGGAGGPFGASFYVNPSYGESGIAMSPAVVLPAVITVEIPCPADLSKDRVVDDADFNLFVQASDLFDCADPAMPDGCPADLNHDGAVDEADFILFSIAYDEVVCQ